MLLNTGLHSKNRRVRVPYMKRSRNYQTITVTMPPDLLRLMEKDMKKLGMSRSEYFRSLLRTKLKINGDE